MVGSRRCSRPFRAAEGAVSARSNLGRPSFGFFLIAGVHCLLVGMLIWGWQQPPLDKAFEILARRDLGESVDFLPSEIQVLQRSLDRHAGFSRALLGKSVARFVEPTASGWLSRPVAHLTVRPEPDHPTELLVEGRGAPGDFPLVVKFHGKGLARQVELLPNEPQKVEWSSSDLDRPTILTVEIAAAKSHASATPSWSVQVESSSPVREAP
jgi:hypothetical protein